MKGSRAPQKILVVGLDGGSWRVLDQLLERGELPTLSRLIERGVSGPLKSVPNAMSPAAWTTFMTGRNPGNHGIYDFYQRRPGSYDIEFVNGSHRKAASLWQLLSRAGRHVGVINVPFTYPAEKLRGFILAGLDAPGVESPGFCHPPEVYREVSAACGGYTMEAGVTGSVMAGRLEEAVNKLYDSIENRLKTSLYLLKSHQWDFLITVFRETDPAQHCLWKFYDAGHPDYDPELGERYGDVIPEVYRRIDAAIARLESAAGPETLIMVVSDHGFGPRNLASQALNPWLASQGLLTWKDGSLQHRGLVARLYQQLERMLSRQTKERLVRLLPGVRRRVEGRLRFGEIDWGNTQAYSDNCRPAIWINLKGREPNGVVEPGPEAEALKKKLVGELAAAVDPESQEKVVDKVYRREDVYQGPWVEKAPDLSIRWRDNVAAGGLLSRDRKPALPVFPTTELKVISGDHTPEGILLAAGPGLNSGQKLSSASIMDLAPTILYLMGLAIPRDMEGEVLKEALDPVLLREHEVSYSQAAKEGADASGEYSDDERELVRERLRSLGYLD